MKLMMYKKSLREELTLMKVESSQPCCGLLSLIFHPVFVLVSIYQSLKIQYTNENDPWTLDLGSLGTLGTGNVLHGINR